MVTTFGPECGTLAEVEWRAVLESTDGPVEHAKICCVQRHWFLLPVAALVGNNSDELRLGRGESIRRPIRRTA